jgi:hypothetical protein
MNNEEEQFEVFTTLMATRAYPSDIEDAKTLEVETTFNTERGRESGVLSTWEEYLNLLVQGDRLTTEQWNIKRIELLVHVLEKMAWILNYDFDKEKVKTGCISTIPLNHFDEIQEHVRREMMQMIQERYGE